MNNDVDHLPSRRKPLWLTPPP